MPEEISVKLPDGSARTLREGATAADLAASIGRGLAKAAVAATVDGRQADLTTPLPDGATVAIITSNTDEGRYVLRHSTAHVMAQAVTDLFPGAKYAIGPAIEDGFYYDFALPGEAHFTDDDLVRIEARMREIVAEDQPFVREELSREEGLARFADQPFKVEIIEGVDPAEGAEGSAVSVYRKVSTLGLGRPVPGPPRAVHHPAGLVQAHAGVGRLLAGRRAPRPAPAHLRHRLGERQGRWPSTSTGWRRPSGATTASSASSSTCSTSRPRSAAACPSSIPRAGSSAS